MSLNDKKRLPYNAEKRRKIKEIKNDELNKQCFDCGSCYPEYISINNGVFICKDCLNIHNKFPKQISTTLKNNLSSLNSKELQFMYLGGNQKLLEFINYEYPQLHKFKLNILYQTKAMQYYRNNLYYLVNGGPKPIKPNEKINAYEIVSPDELVIKNEKINNNNKITKVNNKNLSKEKERNKSVGRMIFPDKKLSNKTNKGKSKTIKKVEEEEKKRDSLNNENDEDSLKRHKSFYKEMNKLFGPELNDDIYHYTTDEKNIYKKQKIKKENYRRKSDLDINNNENKKFEQNLNENNNINSKIKEPPIEHIYNNNYFTLSATKNIFMFTQNKDNIKYSHRKINPINNQNNNSNSNQEIIHAKEIYYKPKIPYLLYSNRKKLNNDNLFFSLKLNENKEIIKNEILIDNINNIKSIGTYTKKNKKSKTNENPEELEICQKSIKNDNNIKMNKNISNQNNNNINEENKIRDIFTKKRMPNKLIKNERKNNENKEINNKKDNNSFIFRKNEIKNIPNDDNKTELKEIKIDKIIKAINDNFHNEVDSNETNIQGIKSKTFKGVKGSKTKYSDINENKLNTNETEPRQQNPIRIEEGEDEISSSPQKIENVKENKISDENKDIQIEKKENQACNNPKLFGERRRQRLAKILGDKKEEKNKNINNDIKNKKENKKFEEKENNNEEIKYTQTKEQKMELNELPIYKEKNKKDQIVAQNQKVEPNKKFSIENIKDINSESKNSKDSSTINEKNSKLINNVNNNIEKNEPKKFSIRNKYKMKKMNEMA